jgi:hypothetical protein
VLEEVKEIFSNRHELKFTLKFDPERYITPPYKANDVLNLNPTSFVVVIEILDKE